MSSEIGISGCSATATLEVTEDTPVPVCFDVHNDDISRCTYFVCNCFESTSSLNDNINFPSFLPLRPKYF